MAESNQIRIPVVVLHPLCLLDAVVAEARLSEINEPLCRASREVSRGRQAERSRMKQALIVLACMSAGLLTAAEKDSAKQEFASEEAKISYSIGVSYGKSLKGLGVGEEDVDFNQLIAGMKDALKGDDQRLDDALIRETLNNFARDMRTKAADQNKGEGQGFLAENKGKEGVKITESGLQYKVITQGTGRKPTSNDVVVAHYRGTLIDGTEFDNSYTRGEPSKFPVTGVIKGWTEALLMMPVGSKWQLFIPSDIAYGERGRPGIPPNSVLLFDIELVGVEEKQETPAPAGPPAPQNPQQGNK